MKIAQTGALFMRAYFSDNTATNNKTLSSYTNLGQKLQNTLVIENWMRLAEYNDARKSFQQRDYEICAVTKGVPERQLECASAFSRMNRA